MEANVIALGVVGDDGEGFELIRGLWNTGVDVDSLVIRADRFTPTYTKPMMREQDGVTHEINRLDIKNRRPMPPEVEDELVKRLAGLLPRVHGVVVADQVPEENCGVITERVREEIIALANAYPTVAFVADSRERIGLFRDVLLKPNAWEAVRAVYPARDDGFSGPVEPARFTWRSHSREPGSLPLERDFVTACGAELYRRAGQPVFLTLGADGILAFHADGPTHIPAVRVTGPIDIVGAGDATMSGIIMALCSGATVPEAAQVGCLAAGVTIQQIGTTGTASREQIAALWQQVSALPTAGKCTAYRR
jgi:bifunctional ADP-heptose synthase (sugar kinase/adenylyltransferase)